jgi:hypothetical protein
MPRRFRGLKRKYTLITNWDLDETEYVSRRSWADNVSKAEFLRSRTLLKGWRDDLVSLRVAQKGLPNDLFIPKLKEA